jgi:tRNA1Val (adenine37-N6)-methyltransferase
MAGDAFEFKQFTIRQDKCAMKVGTDAVLLGAWTACKDVNSILDIGTGTGVIALMLAQKCEAYVDAIEIDENAYSQAVENVNASKWSKRINVHHISLQEFAAVPRIKYDLIVSNPPYFIDSSKASDIERTKARHADMLPFADLATCAKKLLSEKGRFCVILPLKEGELFRDIAETKGMYLSKLTRVRTTEDKKTEKRWLMQFEFKPSEFSENSIVIEKDKRHEYSDEYKELTKDYYLAF